MRMQVCERLVSNSNWVTGGGDPRYNKKSRRAKAKLERAGGKKEVDEQLQGTEDHLSYMLVWILQEQHDLDACNRSSLKERDFTTLQKIYDFLVAHDA